VFVQSINTPGDPPTSCLKSFSENVQLHKPPGFSNKTSFSHCTSFKLQAQHSDTGMNFTTQFYHEPIVKIQTVVEERERNATGKTHP